MPHKKSAFPVEFLTLVSLNGIIKQDNFYRRNTMKIKVFAAMVLLSAAAISRAHGFGLGAQFNFSAGGIFAPGAALVISPSDTTHLAINWYLDLGSEKTNIIGLTFDAVPLTLPIVSGSVGTFNFTLGVGFFANVILVKEPVFNGGLRIPIGFNLMLGRNAFEIYTHVAPSFGVDFLPSLGLSKPFYPVALGARIWFR